MASELLDQPRNPPKDIAPRRYKGAGIFVSLDGYVWEWCPSHPGSQRGVVSQHRLVMECLLGRFLTKQERVHHRNHIRWDNRPENLGLFATHKEHMLDHWKSSGRRSQEWIDRVRKVSADPSISQASLDMSPNTVSLICKENDIVWRRRDNSPAAASLTDSLVRESLQGRSVQQAAKMLGVSIQTLYNRFDHLLNKRTTPGFLNDYKDEVRRLAWKQRLSHKQIADRFCVSESCVHKSFQRWSKQDAKQGELADL